MAWVRSVLGRFLTGAKGIAFELDSEIPYRELAERVLPQAIAIARGLVRLRTRTFLGRGVTIRSRRRLTLGRYVKIGAGSELDCLSRDGVIFGHGVSVGRYGAIRISGLRELGQGVRLGDFVGIGDHFYLGGFGGIEIGAETIIGERFTVHSDNHSFDDPDKAIRAQGTTPEPVVIGPRCWIGSNVTVLGGVEIGADSVIGAGAVVTRSFPVGSVIAGNPARLFRNRLKQDNDG